MFSVLRNGSYSFCRSCGSQVCDIFRSGKSVYHYVLDLRMERFSQLLLASNEAISDLALEVGLSDCKNLARQFKSWKGCTPIEYRMQNRVK